MSQVYSTNLTGLVMDKLDAGVESLSKQMAAFEKKFDESIAALQGQQLATGRHGHGCCTS